MQFHVDGTLPEDGSIFVFGSNLAGIHGAGAALAALNKFGAEYGVGLGQLGRSYAIPTKGMAIKSLPLPHIAQYVAAFLVHAKFHEPKMKFFVTRIGCGRAGYSDADIAPMFKGAPESCSFAQEWESYL